MDSGSFAGIIILSISFGALMTSVVFKYQYGYDSISGGGLRNGMLKSDDV